MPGVIMDHEGRNGSHTNHDRDQRHNGVNGAIHTSEKMQDKGKGRAEPQQNMTPTSPNIPNGINGNSSGQFSHENGPDHSQNRMNQLPPEILHITDGYMSLKSMLQRLTQRTHDRLVTTIQEMYQMPLPASALNGNSSQLASQDDNSKENQLKKQRILDFASVTHEEFLKALVIAGWSRKAEDVSKAIDIKVHLDQEKRMYIDAIDDLAAKKRNFIHARLPNPDLDTAIPVLTTGKGSWMPDLGYIPPPSLTAKDLLRTLQKLNTLLSMRLNLEDYDTIPFHFKEFSIENGRVTFKIDGEFELDLTIADEDTKSQYWFIDFRFLFQPSAQALSPRLRAFIEDKVNDILRTDGLTACYKYLHEMVLTYKISELKRQSIELWRAKWNGTLKVESLNRGLSVQYWTDRYQGIGAKSWIIIGVHSGKPAGDESEEKATSRLMIRWFRDHKEQPVDNVGLDTENLSVEALLKVVIANHINHILRSIFDKLVAQPLYSKRVFGINFISSEQDPAIPELMVQLTNERRVFVKIDPISGRFVLTPATFHVSRSEIKMNTVAKDMRDTTGRKIEDPIDKGYRILESLRYSFIHEDIASHGTAFGWARVPDPGVKRAVLSEYLPKDSQTTFWLRRSGWPKEWYLLVCLNMAEIRWYLIRIIPRPSPFDPNPNALGVGAFLKLPISAVSPSIDYSFMSTLTVFAAGILSHYSNIRALHSSRTPHVTRTGTRDGKRSDSLSMPSILIQLGELVANLKGKTRGKDLVKLTYEGIEVHIPGAIDRAGLAAPSILALDETSMTITEARMVVPLPKDLANLKERVDPDTAFNAVTGLFAFRMRSNIANDVIPALVERISSIEKLVNFVQVLKRHEETLKCDTVSLGKIVFTYGHNPPNRLDSDNTEVVRQTTQYRATIDFGATKGSIALELEKNNPHLRISDYLVKILNSNHGLDGVANILKITLPVLKIMDTIEDAWDDSTLSERGGVFVTVRASDWYVIRYNLRQGSAQDSGSKQLVRRVVFEIRLRDRRGEPWWHVRRTDNSRTKEFDNLDDLLEPLWTASEPNWRGMRSSAVTKGSGTEELLGRMDEVMRTFALSNALIQAHPPVPQPQPQAPVAVMKQAPTQAQQIRQHQRQQPTPNQSQNNSQGQSQNKDRNKPIVIDD